MSTREEILEDEFVRAKIPGLREFSIGILKLARKLRVRSVLGAADLTPAEQTAEHSEQDDTILVWLLDERNTDSAIREAADAGRAALVALLPGYEMQLTPAMLVGAKMQIDRANLVLEKMMFRIALKPSSGESPVPPGK
jgi:hypothetical protein